MEFLKKVLGDGYAAFETAVKEWNAKPENKEKQIKIADIGTGEYVSKSKYDAAEAARSSLESQLATVNTTLKKFEGIDPEKMQGEIAALKTELDSQKKAAENTVKTYALKEQLTKSGVLDPDYLIYRQGGLEKFEFDREGKPVGVEDILKPYKEDNAMSYLFKPENKRPPYQPAGGGGAGGIKNPFAKDSFNLTEQGRLLKENPEQAKAFAAEAGITI